jgi:hypothetical protein
MMLKIELKTSCENRFVCEQVYLIFLLQHWSKTSACISGLQRWPVTDIRGHIYNSIDGGILMYNVSYSNIYIIFIMLLRVQRILQQYLHHLYYVITCTTYLTAIFTSSLLCYYVYNVSYSNIYIIFIILFRKS